MYDKNKLVGETGTINDAGKSMKCLANLIRKEKD